MTHYISYYINQIGSGSGGSVAISSVYRGHRYQRGHGIGSFLGGLLRMAMPYIKSGVKILAREGLKTGIHVTDDVINKGYNFKESLRGRSKEAGRNLQNIAASKIIDVMSGRGYKRRVNTSKRQSRGSKSTRKSASRKKNNKKTKKKLKKRKTSRVARKTTKTTNKKRKRSQSKRNKVVSRKKQRTTYDIFTNN